MSPNSIQDTVIICVTPSTFRTVRHFDRVSPLFSPREPHVRPVAAFPGQSDQRAHPSAVPATGADVGGQKRRTPDLKAARTVQTAEQQQPRDDWIAGLLLCYFIRYLVIVLFDPLA